MPSLTFVGSPARYDSGFWPAVAIPITMLYAVEVHCTGNALLPLYSHKGPPTQWPEQDPLQCDLQANVPALTGDGNLVVECHVVGSDGGPILFRVGRWTAAGTIQWGGSQNFHDGGFAPSLGMGGGHLLLMFQSQMSQGQMSFRSATVDANGIITWLSAALLFPDPVGGGHPAVAVTRDGAHAVVVYEAGDASGNLKATVLDWSPTGFLYEQNVGLQNYDQGWQPRVAVGGVLSGIGPTVVEVHKTLSGPLACDVGVLGQGIGWSGPGGTQFGSQSSLLPAVAVTKDGSQGIEVHMNTNVQGSWDLIYQSFTLS